MPGTERTTRYRQQPPNRLPIPDTNRPSPGASPEDFAASHAALAGWLRRRLTDLSGNPDTAQDLAQKTWQAVWQALRDGRYDPQRAALTTYIYAVSQNIYRHWARRQATVSSHAPALAATAMSLAGSEPDPLADAELIDELRRILRDGAPGLSSDHRQTLTLIAQGATDRELAGALAVAPSTAHARKKAALDALRRHLAQRFDFDPVSAERTGHPRQSP